MPSDSMGRAATAVRTIPIRGQADLTESSAAAMSTVQPAVWFTINDSGHEPVLFAVDTNGAARGRWLVSGARNIDWESMSSGPCGADAAAHAADRCLYVGDTGDNDAKYATRAIYRMREPAIASDGAASSDLRSASSTRLSFRYVDGPRDVEAMYVAPDASIYLITKSVGLGGQPLRPAAVYRLLPEAWKSRGTQEAELVDSLPIGPGSAFARFITDAALSADAKHLAVRTYTQVYVFATDSTTGRVRADVQPATCDIAGLQEAQGEGIAWVGTSGRFLLTSEGRGGPFRIANCPMPH
jgi:hypothetical protein